MIIYPAIDLLDQKCVRLSQGRYDQVTVYSENPEEMALSFKEAGAQWIHVVDLDAARTGQSNNKDIIARIVKNTGLSVQTGGGIRDISTLKYLIEDVGVARCVIGTSAIRDTAFTEKALCLYSDKIAIGLDAKNGEIAIDGWTAGSGVNVIEFAHMMIRLGAKTFVYTDIAKDGMLSGPAEESTKILVQKTGADIIASGGISSNEDVESIKSTGCKGVIIGKAIYEGKVRLEECLQKG